MTTFPSSNADVLIIGAGPAGLSAAIELRRLGIEQVVIAERECDAGGVPRHCNHTGFGLRDLHRSMSGPRYSAELVRRALASGAQILIGTTVTELGDGGLVHLTNRSGIHEINARAVLIASGARERPRSARLVPGDRPSGIFTTGQLQQWTYLKRLPVGSRAIVIGAEHVSFSAMLTLRHAGVRTIALATELAHHQSIVPFALAARTLFHVPIWTNTRLVGINGRSRVSEVVLEDTVSGKRRSESVDTVVFSGGWIPDNELSRRAGLDIDPGTLGPSSDIGGRTSLPSVYAAGNLLHPVETADVVALRGREVARELGGDLRSGTPISAKDRVTLVTEGPLSWVWPNRVHPSQHEASVFLRSSEFDSRRTVAAHQDGRFVGSSRTARVVPNRSLSVSGSFIANIDLLGGPVILSLE